MATKRKPTPAQIAARERFAEMAKSGAFKKKAKRNPMQFYEVINTVTGENEGTVKAADYKLAFDVFARKNGYKNFAEMKQKEKLASNEYLMTEIKRRSNPRASNPIILVSDKPIASKRKRNPVKPKRQRMLNISWTTAGGQRDMRSVPIDFVFTHYVGNVAERFFARTENGQLIVSEYSTGGRIGQVPYTMRAAALNDRDAAKRYVGEMLSRVGAEQFKAAVKQFDPIN